MAIDFTAGVARFRGRRELYLRHLRETMHATQGTLAQIKAELADNNLEEAEHLTHAFRGRVGTLGMTSLFDRLLDLEVAFRNRERIEGGLLAAEAECSVAIAEASSLLENGADIEWNDSYAIGIPELDNQHRELFAIVREIVVNSRATTESVHVVLSRLADYARAHFEAEEKFLKEKGFPELIDHIEEHTRFIDQIATMSLRAMRGQIEPAQLLDFLRAWLLEHILGMDQPDLRQCLTTR